LSRVAREKMHVDDPPLVVHSFLPSPLKYLFQFDDNHFFDADHLEDPSGPPDGLYSEQYFTMPGGVHSLFSDTKLHVATPPLRGTVHLLDDGTFQYVPL